MNYNELTPVQKHVVRAMHYIWLSKKDASRYSPVELIFGHFYHNKNIYHKHIMYIKTKAWIHKRAYENECMRLTEIPKRIPGYTNEKARREAKEVVDYVRAEYRRMNSGLSKIS